MFLRARKKFYFKKTFYSLSWKLFIIVYFPWNSCVWVIKLKYFAICFYTHKKVNKRSEFDNVDSIPNDVFLLPHCWMQSEKFCHYYTRFRSPWVPECAKLMLPKCINIWHHLTGGWKQWTVIKGKVLWCEIMQS